LFGDSINIIIKNKGTLLEASTDVGLEIDAENTKLLIISSHSDSEQNQNKRIVNESFENMAKFKYLLTTIKSKTTFIMKSRVD